MAVRYNSNGSAYDEAIKLLNSTQTGFKVLEERRRLGQKLHQDALAQMRHWLSVVGYTPSDLSHMNIIHVSGTKGKGSTCAFTNSILQRYSDTIQVPRKIGLYTSPHIIAVRERIMLNSQPLSEELFAKYFFEVWKALEAKNEHKPPYFRFLTLLSFHVFMRENVDAAIYEVGVGGELDSTNVIEKPVATAITTLGIDHTKTLGDTVDRIAWHKGGIMKSGSPAFTTTQVPEAMQVLDERAAEKGVQLTKVTPGPAIDKVALVPPEDFQKKNASVAVELARTMLTRLGVSVDLNEEELPSEFVQGLENLVWRGRFETLVTGKQRWHLDGAHNESSLQVAGRWFGRLSQSSPRKKILMFNQQSTRDSHGLLEVVQRTLTKDFGIKIDHAIFCTDMTYKDQSWDADHANHNVNPAVLRTLTLQRDLAETWQRWDPASKATALPTIEDAVEFIRELEGGDAEVDVLVTGSFHLVGSTLRFLENERS